MKGLGVSVLPLLAGFRTDIERLLNKFKQKESLRFEKFAECFRDMKFSAIYRGRESEAELKEVEEATLMMAVSYCLPSTATDDQTTVGGVYLIYALYHMQPVKHRAAVRVTVSQLKRLLDLSEQLRRDGHNDTVYCLQRLFFEKAFVVCAYLEEMNPLYFKKYDNLEDMDLNVMTAAHLQNTDELSELVSSVACQQAELMHAKYVLIKRETFAGGAAADDEAMPSDLRFCNTGVVDVVKQISEDYHEKIKGRHGSHHGATSAKAMLSKTNDAVTTNRRLLLKQKAYSQVARQAKHRRHRQQDGDDERLVSPTPLPSGVSMLKSPMKRETASSAIKQERHSPPSSKAGHQPTKATRKGVAASNAVQVPNKLKGKLKVVAPTKRKVRKTNESAKGASEAVSAITVDREVESTPKQKGLQLVDMFSEDDANTAKRRVAATAQQQTAKQRGRKRQLLIQQPTQTPVVPPSTSGSLFVTSGTDRPPSKTTPSSRKSIHTTAAPSPPKQAVPTVHKSKATLSTVPKSKPTLSTAPKSKATAATVPRLPMESAQAVERAPPPQRWKKPSAAAPVRTTPTSAGGKSKGVSVDEHMESAADRTMEALMRQLATKK